MSWCILELSRNGTSMFKLFQSFSLNEGDWKLTNIHDVEEKAFNYIISDHLGNSELVYKGCEGATPQVEEAIAEWKKELEVLRPGDEIICTPLADFIDRFKRC